MAEDRELIAAFGQLASGYNHDKVVSAAANILLNALRQKHSTLAKAEAQLDEVEHEMRAALRTRHYHDDGSRNNRRIVIPPLRELMRI